VNTVPAEVFQDRRALDRLLDHPHDIGWHAAQTLRLLDLTVT
jgi:hypothetical protein